MQTDSVITRFLEGNKRDILIKLNISNQKHLHKHRAREKKDIKKETDQETDKHIDRKKSDNYKSKNIITCSIASKSSAYGAKGPRFKNWWRQEFKYML